MITIIGVTLFIVVVLSLHLIQKGYDPINQLMSELALGQSGGIMFLAFLGLAISSLGVQIILINRGANFFLHLVLAGVTICFAGSGIFTLGNAATIHIILIEVAFVLAGLAMYLFPLLAGSASTGMSRYVSWGFAIAMACSIVLGYSLTTDGNWAEIGNHIFVGLVHIFGLAFYKKLSAY